MRGKDHADDQEQGACRITPASAGKSTVENRMDTFGWDHPRECGEKLCNRAGRYCTMGSPPRVRGKGGSLSLPMIAGRITPASAGKSSTDCRSKSGRRDHPRECGEKRFVAVYPPLEIGSPPRVRGKEGKEMIKNQQGRITPASAGKRTSPCCIGMERTYHPRECGEKKRIVLYATFRLGSPPRVRGKVTLPRRPPAAAGITPASAGKRWTVAGTVAARWDHPRECGEKRHLSSISDFERGSPPRVRGKVGFIVFVQTAVRITPASAGKSTGGTDAGKPRQDHPRECGEKAGR